MSGSLRTLPIVLLIALGSAADAQAGEAGARSLAVALGTPARAEAVSDALEAAADGERDAADLARALAAAGGVEAARGLGALLRRREQVVRIEALQAVARLRLRSDDLAEAVHGILADARRAPPERAAAIAALAAVGDGRDLDVLLAITADDTETLATTSAAFRALGEITGANIPFVASRWSYWWRKKQVRAVDHVERAMAALAADPRGASAAAHEATLAAEGWVDIVGLRGVLEGWLTGSHRHLVPVGCRLAAHHRLADLEPALRRAGRRLQSEDVQIAVQAAMGALGVGPVEGLR